jgi:hypothetical protein
MIIVEGVDGAGKTTLIRQLKEVIPELIVLPSPFTIGGDFFQDCAIYLQKYKESKVHIVDRFFFSELVYGPLRRSKLLMDSDQIGVTSRFIEKYGCPIIWCHPPFDVVIDGVANQPTDIGQNIGCYYLYYESIMPFYWRQMFEYDWTDKNGFNYLLEFLGRKQ